MAKRTPDYTKQVRHEKPSRRPAVPAGKKTTRKAEVPPPPKGAAALVIVSLLGGVALYVWACLLALGNTDTRRLVFSLTVGLCGVVTNILTGVLALYALNPQRFPMRRLDKRMFIVIIVVFGAIVVFFSSSYPILAPGIIAPVAVFFFVIRPRLKVIAQVAGSYRPTRRDDALAEIQERREERQREKERDAQLKRTLKRRQERDQAGGAAGRGGSTRTPSNRGS